METCWGTRGQRMDEGDQEHHSTGEVAGSFLHQDEITNWPQIPEKMQCLDSDKIINKGKQLRESN